MAMTDGVNLAIREGRLHGFLRQLNWRVASIYCNNMNTRRCYWDFSVLKHQIIGQQLLPRRNRNAEILFACNARTNKGQKFPTPRDKYTSGGKCKITLSGNKSAMEATSINFPQYQHREPWASFFFFFFCFEAGGHSRVQC